MIRFTCPCGETLDVLFLFRGLLITGDGRPEGSAPADSLRMQASASGGVRLLIPNPVGDRGKNQGGSRPR